MINKDHAETIKMSIRKEESEKIQKENKNLQVELVETRAALLSYKNMHECIDMEGTWGYEG